MTDRGLWAFIHLCHNIKECNKKREIENYDKLMKLDISHNFITDNSFKAFCRLIRDFPLIQLNVSNNVCLSSKSFENLFDALKSNYTFITDLNYSNNSVKT